MMYVIYKTTNTTDGKFYIGFHSTPDLNDSYMGSGKLLRRAMVKHGVENFTKEILYVFPTKEEALLKENEIVDGDFVNRDDTYNLKIGGEGGWDYINERVSSDPEFKSKMYKKSSERIKELYSLGVLRQDGKHNGNYGKTPWNKGLKTPEETKKKISENNGNKLPKHIVKERIKDVESIEKKRGYITRLSKKWGTSHTQVRRFINKNKK